MLHLLIFWNVCPLDHFVRPMCLLSPCTTVPSWVSANRNNHYYTELLEFKGGVPTSHHGNSTWHCCWAEALGPKLQSVENNFSLRIHLLWWQNAYCSTVRFFLFFDLSNQTLNWIFPKHIYLASSHKTKSIDWSRSRVEDLKAFNKKVLEGS